MKKIILQILIVCFSIFLNLEISNAQNKILDHYNPIIVKKGAVPAAGTYTVLKSAFNVTLRDNVVLDCSRFYPNVADPNFPNGYPTVIMCHGYGENKSVDSLDAVDQASYGFVVYTYSMRGQGFSGGLSNLISTLEAQDLIEFVNFIKHDNITRLDSSKILIEGGSQGGIIPFMASSMGGLNVKCILSDLATPEEGTQWIENNSIKMTFLWTISYTSNIARYNNLITAMRGWIYADTPEKYDSLAYWLPIGRDFKTQLSQITIPVFCENTWQDMFFNTTGNINYAIPIITAPKRFYFGAVNGHGGETSNTENLLINQLWGEWYDYWLSGINNNLLNRPKYYFAYTEYPLTNNKWTFVHDSSYVWPPTNTMDLKLYFNQYGTLKTTPGRNNYKTSMKNDVISGMTMKDAVDNAFTGTFFNNHFSKSQLVFDSSPITRDIKMIGNQTMSLDFSSNVNKYQFNIQIYDVQNTTSKLVTRANYTGWHNIPNSRNIIRFYGLSHSHIFKAGNKIRIIITNLDTSPNDIPFLSTNPYVLPSLVNGNNNIFLDSSTYFDMQVKSPGFGMASSSFFKEDPDEYIDNATNLDNSTKLEYKLIQNNPNPFNPSTSIQFSIPENGFVTLRIYDVTGKEIATLVDEQKIAGEYSINFNADYYHLSSGVYFYKLSAPGFSQIKKMLLIK
jgi:predicted acyl esterase